MKYLILSTAIITSFIGSQSMAANYHCRITKNISGERIEKDIIMTKYGSILHTLFDNKGNEAGYYLFKVYDETGPKTTYLTRDALGMEKISAMTTGNNISLSDSQVFIKCDLKSQ